jgi:alkanesulfonate monooxygenase SsuD/methylene tetrahydromethanopterin reductase-like flavin-dependent oxidoreductase (luciferase family)
MSNLMPAVSLAAVPGRRRRTLDLAAEIERRGFAGIYCPSLGDALGLCQSIAHTTERIPFGTSIVNIYSRHAADYASTASYLHEISGGRFRFGVGVSHGPMLEPMGIEGGRPLADTRSFVETWREAPRMGERPPLILAGLRKKMVELAGEVADGVVFANVARSHVPSTLGAVSGRLVGGAENDFFVGDMIPTCISEDLEAAKEVNRKTLVFYCSLPNYRNYWKEAGYVEEMEAIEVALANKERERIPRLMSDRWLADCTLFGPADAIREGVEAWREAGVSTPILVPSSTKGGQLVAFEELFEAFA